MTDNNRLPERTQVDPGRDSIRMSVPLIIFLALIVVVFLGVRQHLESQFDFGVFYFAGHMITDGARHDLYSFAAQNLYQIRFHRPPDTLFRNPPIALIPILPLTFLPAAAAFAVWTALSIVLLIVSLKILEKETDLRFGNWPILLGLLFVPILDSLQHGQFTVCIVLVYVMTYAQWRKGNRALGGAILALAEMKFQPRSRVRCHSAAEAQVARTGRVYRGISFAGGHLCRHGGR